MIRLKPNQDIPESNYSRKKLWFICDCGKEKQIIWKNYKTNHTKSCGSCSSKYDIDNIVNQKFGHLTIDVTSLPTKINSKTKLNFNCDCGKTKEIILKSVVNGLTKTCGCRMGVVRPKHIKPVLKTKEYWLNKKLPLKLLTKNDDLPSEWSKGSGKVFLWECGCKKRFECKFCSIYSGHRLSCGECDFVNKTEFLNNKFGKLQLLDIDLPEKFHKNTDSSYWFKCDCGNKKKISIHSITKNNQTTCGECNVKPKKWWIGRKYYHLTVLDINCNELKLYSEQMVKCRCSCGTIKEIQASALNYNKAKTCGSCLIKAYEWHANRQALPVKTILGNSGIYELHNLQKYFEGSLLEPLESAKNTSTKIKFRCKLCNFVFKTKLTYICHNNVCSCGCINGSYSLESHKLGKFISNNVDCYYGKNEKILSGYKVDIYVPNTDLIIEFNGLRYHSDILKPKNLYNDVEKYKKLSKKHNYMMIYEDEWATRNDCFKRLILNKINNNIISTKIRPQKCNIKLIKNKEVEELYEKFHYQGHVNSTYNIGAFFDNKLVACMSIKKPTRQKSGDWEISRMVCDNDYRVHGLWSYLIKWINKEQLISGKVISFSDNRLMAGNVYKIMGFTHVSDVKPDYYWVKNGRRHHKSALRKTEQEKLTGKTEVELRESQGYHKIMDLGKKKWELII